MAIRFSDLLLFSQWQSRRQTSLSPQVVSLIISFVVTICLLLLNSTGCFQVLEWLIFDQYFRLRPEESVEPRLLIVTIDEPDLSQLRQWPLSDYLLADALAQIDQYRPTVIGLDLYRDFPIPPGTSTLETLFRTMPHLYGVEKIGGTPVPPPPILAKQGQVAMADLVMDDDGKVRRALLSISDEGKVRQSLGSAVALHYLESQGISPESLPSKQLTRLGDTLFPRLQMNDGGYIRADVRGYQILLNFRGAESRFDTVSIIDVLEDRVPVHLIRDRIVLIGSIAPSLNDFVYTPYSRSHLTNTTQSPGVAIHAHIASQIVSTVLEGRSLIRTWITIMEWGWAFLWCSLGSRLILMSRWQKLRGFNALLALIIPVLGLSLSLVVINGIWFLNGWWVPTIPALLGLITSVTVGLTTNNLKLLKEAYVDDLTNVLNRRSFNQHMVEAQQQSKDLAIILCDIDFFKGFNDFYGHPVGDSCLQRVARAIQQSVHGHDLVARYGGEEFAIILQSVSSSKAYEIAERMREGIQNCRIPHAASKVSAYVSISCGVAVRLANTPQSLTETLIRADQALYQAKRTGRNKVVLAIVADNDANI
ncbi:MAG: CHASE2 domain-containing protein [Cyanobacteria bacterium P01_D01_bin.156]